MKLYRGLPYIDSETILAHNPKAIGINYEASNLKLGFCSPSAEYLRYQKNPRSNLNTFTIMQLAKYFYPSLFDALAWANKSYLANKATGLPMNFLIWEVDIPDFIVEKYLGVGQYDNELKIEAKIPYSYLASYLSMGVKLNYSQVIAEFFSQYYSWKNADPKAIANLKSQLGEPTLENPELLLTPEDEIYRALCFPIFMASKILVNEDEKWLRVFDNTIYEKYQSNRRFWSRQINYNCKNWDQVGHGSVIEYLFSETEFLKYENAELKRTLNKNGYKFQ